MKTISGIFCLLNILNTLLAQNMSEQVSKPSIDTSAFYKWPSIGDGKISNNGEYVMYYIFREGPISPGTLILQSTSNNWKMHIPGGANVFYNTITSDNRFAVLSAPNDSLCIVTLGDSATYWVPYVNSFKTPSKCEDKWLAYHLKQPKNELILMNLTLGSKRTFPSVKDYLFNDDGSVLLLTTTTPKNETTAIFLQWVNLTTGKIDTIWTGGQADNFIFDKTSSQLAFIERDKATNETKSMWYYRIGKKKATPLIDSNQSDIPNNLKIESIQKFSLDESRIYISLTKKEPLISQKDGAKVDIWSYKDTKLQSVQLAETNSHTYTSIINILDRKIYTLQQENESLDIQEYNQNDDYILVNQKDSDTDYDEWNWNKYSWVTTYLVSTRNGNRKFIRKTENASSINYLSPEGKYVVYYDPKQKNYFSYEITTETTRNITEKIPTSWTVLGNDQPDSTYSFRPIAGWLKDKKAVLLYDQYDIWQVDLTTKKAAINLTNGYGRQHNTVFRLGIKSNSNNLFAEGENIILSAFDKNTKDNGFYRKIIGKKGYPELLSMEPYLYDWLWMGNQPIKAKNAEKYLVKRESAVQSPNYFWTKDFKTFQPLSNVQPENAYNWLTTELIAWKGLDGRSLQGILYKPENFNPENKYPIIFYYYEKLSDELNQYKNPKASEDRINIPWFVSNGYLVFTPDIHYKVGLPGESALNSLVSAANHLSKYNFVDSTKMGVQGHSFGGYETNYLITHTNIFSAAVSASGISNLVSSFGSIRGADGTSNQFVTEHGQGRMGTVPWERPDLYIKNSPIFSVHKVSTPLLMMNNKDDGAISFSQGVEFFTALRRLGKKVWMLQYDGEVHSLLTPGAQKDYTIRITQFFDHYLKQMPAPKWMTKGIPASSKGTDHGLDIDYNIKTPTAGLTVDTTGKKVTKNEDVRK